jgi:ornithine carbamoyltransferase
MHITIISPKRYWPQKRFVKKAEEIAHKNQVTITITEDIEAIADADILVTDTWVSLWFEDNRKQRLKDFQKYTINNKIMNKTKHDTIFMHCMPIYYGEEVGKDVAHGPRSVIIDEAENRMWAQMALLILLFQEI